MVVDTFNISSSFIGVNLTAEIAFNDEHKNAKCHQTSFIADGICQALGHNISEF
ncbi:hypothetical protein GPUN_1933 [Glaciecola punicea ACAM 611]|uniref:Uncharacterized protein n=1 Tax=Glaciecola punicea ACAM 611 TaxID=1121923 RepID=H5TCM1_9ALTE|nr:hypothetical protein GPUN_1933 [Glaciecola punicea ACAM 611]